MTLNEKKITALQNRLDELQKEIKSARKLINNASDEIDIIIDIIEFWTENNSMEEE